MVVTATHGPALERTPHVHAAHELLTVEQGTAVFLTGFASHPVPPGALLLVAPALVHSLQTPPDAAGSALPLTVRGLQLDAGVVEHWRRARERASGGAHVPMHSRSERGPDMSRLPGAVLFDDGALTAQFRRAHEACVGALDAAMPPTELDTLGAALTVALATGIGRALTLTADDARSRFPLRVPPGEHGAVQRAREHLETHWAASVTLEQLAAVAHLSASHLARAFTRDVGLPPHTFQVRLRVAHAAARLARGHDVAHVAFDTGFADQSHLARHFRRVYGLTPGAFAKGFHARGRTPDGRVGPASPVARQQPVHGRECA